MTMNKRSQLMDLLTNIINYVEVIQEEYIRVHLKSELSSSEIHVIEAIELENESTMSNVARRLMVTTGTLTTSTNKIIQKGYIEKKQSHLDKRVTLLVLTDKGHQAFDIHKKFHEKMEEVIVKEVSSEEYSYFFGIVRNIYSSLITQNWDEI